MKDAISLSRVQVPNQLFVSKRCGGRHHPIYPLWIPQRLVHKRRLVTPGPLHVKMITALQRNRTSAAHLFCVDSTSQGDLACHRGAADDGLVEAQLLDKGSDTTDVCFLCIGVAT